MNSSFNSFNLITVTISSFTPAIPGNQYEYVTACSAGSAQASYMSRLERHGVLERKRALDESKDPGCIEGVASERRHVLSCWNLNRGHGRLFNGNSRPLGNKQHHHFLLSLPPLFILHRSFRPQPFRFTHSIVRERPLPSQRLNHTLPSTKFSLQCLKGFRFACEWQPGLY
jgi:hypothetical protein